MASANIIYSTSSGDVLSYQLDSKYLEHRGFSKIKDVISERIIYPRFRISVLNADETVRYSIPNNIIRSDGSYNENYQNGQRRTLSFSVINEDNEYTPSINRFWVGTKLLLELGIQIPHIDDDREDEDIVWFNKGVYVITSASPSHNANDKTVSFECSDKFAILEGKEGTIPTTYNVPVNTDIEALINDILGYNSGNGNPMDPKPIIYDSKFKGRKTPLTLSESAGSTWGQLILKIADILSAEVFYNSDGNLTFVPIVEVTQDSDKPVIFDYYDNDMYSNFQSDSFQFDYMSFVNQVYVIGSNVNGHTCQAVATNDDAASPLCIQRIGYHIAPIVNDTNITNDILAQERADYELRKNIIAQTSINAGVFFNPLLTVNNLVTVTDGFFGLQRERILVKSVSCSLGYDGTMSITATNIANLPFVLN